MKPQREPVRTAADVRRLLAAEVEQLARHPDLDPIRRGRAVAQLARVALQAIRVDELDVRLEAVELALKLRRPISSKEEKE